MISPVGSFIVSLDAKLMAAIGNIVSAMATWVATPLSYCACFYLLVQGVRLANGDMEVAHGLVLRLVRVVVIVWLATNLTAYTTYVQQAICTDLPNALTSVVTSTQGSSADVSSVASSFDNLYAQVGTIVATAWQSVSFSISKQHVMERPATTDAGWDISFDPAAQLQEARTSSIPVETPRLQHGLELLSRADVLDRLWSLIDSRKGVDPEVSHSARLLARGAPRVAQKLGEEATECVIEIMGGTREGLIGESADLLYHLLVAWVHAGVRPEEIWRELHRRERVSRRGRARGREGAIRRLLGSARAKTTKIP